MKKFLPFLMVSLAVFFLSGCKPTEEPARGHSPKILKVEQIEGSLSQTAVNIIVHFEDSWMLHYSVTPDGDESNKFYTEIEVEEGSDVSEVIKLTNLTPATKYIFKVTPSYGDTFGMPKTLIFTTDAEEIIPTVSSVVVDSEAITTEAVPFNVAYSNADAIRFTYNKTSDGVAESAKQWIEKIVEEGSTSVDLEITEFESASDYTLEVVAVLGDKLSDVQKAEFTTLTVETFDVTFSEDSPFSFRVNIDFTPGDADCYYYYTTLTSYVTGLDYTLNSIIAGYENDNIYFESESILFDNGGFGLSPNSSYTTIIIPIKTGEDGGFIPDEAGILSLTHSSENIVAGETSDVAPFDMSEAVISFASVEIAVKRNEGVRAFYSDAVKVSDVPDGDFDSWLAKYDFGSAFIKEFVYEEYDGTEVVKDEIKHYIMGLDMNEDYYVFTLPITLDNKVGTATVEQFTTLGVGADNDETIKWDVAVEARAVDADITFTFGDKCEKIFYAVYDSQVTLSDEEIYEALKSQITSGYAIPVLKPEGSSVAVVEGYELDAGEKDYRVCSIGVDADGNVGVLNKVAFQTSGIAFNSDATVEYTITDQSTDEWGDVIITVDIAMSNGAVKYKFAMVDKFYDVGENPTAEDYGAAALDRWDIEDYTDASLELEFSEWANGDVAVFIPVDENGAFGTPALLDYTDDDDK